MGRASKQVLTATLNTSTGFVGNAGIPPKAGEGDVLYRKRKSTFLNSVLAAARFSMETYYTERTTVCLDPGKKLNI